MILKVVFNNGLLPALGAAIALLAAAPAAAQDTPTEATAPAEVDAPDAPSLETQPTTEPAPAPPASGPTVELPVDATSAEPDAPEREIEERDLIHGLRDYRFEQTGPGGSVLGGYGELHYNLKLPEGGESDAGIDLHRLVFFAAHKFSEEFRLYAEIEIEHAFSSLEDQAPGEVEVEQAFVDWKPWGEALQLRAGIVLVPMGIINQWHEPPVFNGVERPLVDKIIIPSTWREGGVGIFGEPVEGLRYELYLVGGLNPMRFDAEASIREGRQSVAEAVANGPAVTARVEWEPALGVVLGGSAYYGVAGPNADDLHRLAGRDPITDAPILADLEPAVPVLGLGLDARLRLRGFEARAVFATFSVGDTAALRAAVDPTTGESLGLDVGARSLGTYCEVAYDVLRLMTETDQQLLPFVRVEYWDTAFSLTRARTPADDALRGTDVALGLSYRPITQVVFKADFILRTPGAGPANRLVDLGVGWMF